MATEFDPIAFAKMTDAEKLELFQRMAAEKQALEAKVAKEGEEKRKKGELDYDVSEKGALMVRGLQRFPVTLYLQQWVQLLGLEKQPNGSYAFGDMKTLAHMLDFINKNVDRFSVLTEEQKKERREKAKEERANQKRVTQLEEAKKLIEQEEAKLRGEAGRATTIPPR